jgi:hypothetical protein
VKKNATLLIGVQGMWGSIEWILPACKYLRENFIQSKVVIFILRDSRRDIFVNNKELEELTNEIISGECFSWYDMMPNVIKAIYRFLRSLDRVPPIQFGAWLSQKLIRFFRRIAGDWLARKLISNVQPDVALLDNHRNPLFKVLKRNGVRVGFLLTAPSFSYASDTWVDRETQKERRGNIPYDFFLVDTKWTANFYRKLYIPETVLQVGCPKFDKAWLDFVRTRRKSNNDEASIGSRGGRTVLVLLKNDSSVIFKHISFASVFFEIMEACQNIDDVNVILKPHPRQDLELLKKMMSMHSKLNVTVSNENLIVLFARSDLIIAMPSGVILDALIAGHPVIEFFNYPLLGEKLDMKFKEIPLGILGGLGALDENGGLTSVFRARDLVVPADTRRELWAVIQKFLTHKQVLACREIRDIFPDNASRRAAEAIMAMT